MNKSMAQHDIEKNPSAAGQTLLPAVFRLLLGIAVLTVIAGAFVSTYGAGLAIPDWPTSFGKIVLLYSPIGGIPFLPAAPWEVFLAQAHRFLGLLAFVLAVVGLILCWFTRPTWSVRMAAVAAVLAIGFQLIVGAFRIWSGTPWSAKLLACSAPLVFLVVLLSTEWVTLASRRQATLSRGTNRSARTLWIAPFLAGWVYFQVVAGTQLRHAGPTESPYWFLFWVWVHVLSGLGLALGTILAAWFVNVGWPGDPPRAGTASLRILLAGVLVPCQVVLGGATWLSRFGVPRWFTDYVASWHLTLESKAPLEILASTSHVVLGIVILALCGSAVAWSIWGDVGEVKTD